MQIQQQRSFDRRLEVGESFSARDVLAGVDSVKLLVNQSLVRHSQHETTLRQIQSSVQATTMPSDHMASSDMPCPVSSSPQQTLDDPQRRWEKEQTKQPCISHSDRGGQATAYTPRSAVLSASRQDLPDSVAKTLRAETDPSHLSMARICNGECDCICHGRSDAIFPKFAIGVLGPFSVVYKGPSSVKTCTSPGCRELLLTFRFACPPWLADWALEGKLVSSAPGALVANYRKRKFAPENAPIFWAVRTGALDHVRRLLSQQKAFPTDASIPEGKTILLVGFVRETPQTIIIDCKHRLQ